MPHNRDRLFQMNTPPDLCIIGYDLRASGVVRNALRIAAAAQAAGLNTELWVAYADGPLKAEVPAGVVLRDAGHGRKALGRTTGLAASILPLAAYLRERRPRIALSSGNHLHLAAALAYRLAGRPGGVKLWARASNAPLQYPLGAWLGRPLPPLAGRMVNAINRLQYDGFERIIAVCRELGDSLADDLAIAPDRITVIPNGVDVDNIGDLAAKALDHPWMADGQTPVIMAVGRLSKQKNFADLVEVLARVRQRIPARLVILGDGPPARKAELKKRAADLGVADAVLLAGFDANPFRWLGRASLVAISSLWEGSSNVALEALAAGTPIVAYRCPTGITEVVAPAGAENVVAMGDLSGFADAIVRRLRLPKDSARLKAYARGYEISDTLNAYVADFRRALQA